MPVSAGLEVRHHTFPAAIPIHYAEIPSSGPPMVLLHGIGMDWRVWQAVSRRLAHHFHLYLVDLRGHGQSGKPEHGYTLPHYAADIEDLLDGLGLNRVTLVGSSLGAMVAAVVEAPVDMVGHRVLVDPPLTGGPIRDEAIFRTILYLKHRPVPELTVYLAGQFLLCSMAEMWHEAADGVIEDMLAQPDDYNAIDPALANDGAEVLLMQADPGQGAVLESGEARRALALLPHGSLVTVPGAGHAIHAFKPREFVELIRRFTDHEGEE